MIKWKKLSKETTLPTENCIILLKTNSTKYNDTEYELIEFEKSSRNCFINHESGESFPLECLEYFDEYTILEK